MNLKYYEKITIAIIVFLGVSIATGYIIGCYSNVKKSNNNKNNSTSIILENVNLF